MEMFYLEKEKTGSTPYVLIDEAQKYMKITGESFSENVVDFFKDTAQWLREYLETDFEKLTFDCELTYFNSSTAKLLLNMFLDIDEMAEGKEVVINWITSEEDDINIECGEDFQEDMENVTFHIVLK